MKELTVSATLENIPVVTEFVDAALQAADCPAKAQAQIDMVIDELFSNIARYAYAHGVGDATVRVETEREPRAVYLTFIDGGKRYNPLEKEDPDVTLPAEKREAGGLGVFLVKRLADDIHYEYRNGKNILRIKKNL